MSQKSDSTQEAEVSPVGKQTIAMPTFERSPILSEFAQGYYGWRVVLAACFGTMAFRRPFLQNQRQSLLSEGWGSPSRGNLPKRKVQKALLRSASSEIFSLDFRC